MRHWIAHHSLDVIAFLAGIGQASQDGLRMILYKRTVVHVELLDGLSALACQNLRGKDIIALNVVLAEFHVWVHHATQIVVWSDLKEHNFSLAERSFNIELADLGYLYE